MKKRTWAIILPVGAAVLLSGAAFFDHTIAAENTETIRSAVEASSQQEVENTTESTITSTTPSSTTSTSTTTSTAEIDQAKNAAPASAEEELAPVAESEVAVEDTIPAAEPVSAPVEQTIAADIPAEQAAPAAEPTAVAAYQPMTLYIAGQAIPYQNGGTGSGQGIIDSNPNGTAATWGGAPVQSGDDGLNTHIIGHNPGAFSALFSVGAGSQITVTDGAGTPTVYTVQNTMQVDDYGKELSTGSDVWDLTVGTGGGERITLQTCINDDVNLFVLAYK